MDWYPHSIDDYDADTLHLSVAQDGVYGRLLRWYYKNERPLPDNDQALASIARIGLDEWLGMAPIIRAFFVARQSRVTGALELHQKRCNSVIVAQNKKRKDGKRRQEKLRKYSILDANNELSRVSNAPRGEESRVEKKTQSLTDRTESPTTTVHSEAGGAGGSAVADAPAAPRPSKPPRKPAKPKTARTRLPDTWEPNQRNRSYGHVSGLTDSQIDFIAIRFRRYWTGPDARNPVKADWDRTWENWVDREIQDGALGRGNGAGGSRGNGREPDSGLARFLDRRLGAGGDQELSDVGREPARIHSVSPPARRPRPGPIPGFGPGETIVEPDEAQ